MRIIDIHQHLMSWDPTGDMLVRYLDVNGIEKAVALGGVPPFPVVQGNEAVAAAVRRHPDRLIGGVYVDPRKTDEARRLIREYHGSGFKVAKGFPAFGYYPDDPAIFPVYEVMEELGMVLLNHTGGVQHNDQSAMVENGGVQPELVSIKYDLPWHYDAPARCFPKLTIILAHMGLSTWNLPDIFYQVSRHPNLYLDTSSSTAIRAIKEIARVDNQYVWPLDFRKLLWGRDGYRKDEMDAPSVRVQAEQQAVRDMVKDEEILSLVMYGNAARLLGVTDNKQQASA